ncbi:MAG TPA: threonine synthase [Firmicutes bacterium]|jgi:threonine synthase|nr:threonine synthase [Candidatus Fermentithermobacillaceae bacterium]
MATYLKELYCPKCDKTYEASRPQNLCECGTPLLVRYDLGRLAKEVNPDVWKGRPEGLWRYRELLPVSQEENMLSLGEGGTPVYSLDKIASEYGLKKLFLKDEGMNPTGSFKARGAAVGVGRAKELGLKALAMPTAGNAGAAWSAYTSRAGIKMVVVMPEDAPLTTQAECVAYGAETYLVRGLISDAGKAVKEACAKYGWFEVATLKEPYRIEGKKTMGLEIWEQFEEDLPSAIIYPTGGGVGIIGMWKAFNELKEMGWLRGPLPKMVAVQAEGCAPIVKAYREGKDKADFFQGAHTVAAGIRVPSALGDFLVLEAVRKSGGTALTVTDDEILAAWSHLAKTEGALICPEGAAAVVAAKKIKEMAVVGADDSVLILNTGAGMKYIELLKEKAKLLETGSLVN